MSRTIDTATISLIINGRQARQQLDEINRQLETARRRKLAAFEQGDAKGIQVYAGEIRKLERQARDLQTRGQTVTRVLGNLDKATPRELRRTISELTRELSSGKVERGSREWEVLTTSLRHCRTQLQQINEETRAFGAATQNTNPIARWGANWVGTFTIARNMISDAVSGLRGAFEGAILAYADMSEHTAGVTKYTGLAKEEVDALNASFKRMDTRTPREVLNDLAADAVPRGL